MTCNTGPPLIHKIRKKVKNPALTRHSAEGRLALQFQYPLCLFPSPFQKKTENRFLLKVVLLEDESLIIRPALDDAPLQVSASATEWSGGVSQHGEIVQLRFRLNCNDGALPRYINFSVSSPGDYSMSGSNGVRVRGIILNKQDSRV